MSTRRFRGRKPKQSPGYLERLLGGEVPLDRRGKVTHVFVRHDDDCPMLAGLGHCNCVPDIDWRPDDGELS